MSLMLELAGLSSSGPRGLVRTKGLMAIHLATMRVFLRDESMDLAKTMAALDGHLRRVEGLIQRFGGGRRRADSAERDSEKAADAAS